MLTPGVAPSSPQTFYLLSQVWLTVLNVTGLSFWAEPAGSRLAGVLESLLISLVTPLLSCFKVRMSAMNKCLLKLHGAKVTPGFNVGTHAGAQSRNVAWSLIPSRLEMTAIGLFPLQPPGSLSSRPISAVASFHHSLVWRLGLSFCSCGFCCSLRDDTAGLKYVLMCVRLLQGPPSASHILTFLVQQEPYTGSNLTGSSGRLNYISAVAFCPW